MSIKSIPSTIPRKSNHVAIIGEAPGATEEEVGRPFVGKAGDLERSILTESGIDPEQCFWGNVFSTRPLGNDIEHYCSKKAEVGGKDYLHPPLSQGKYVRPEHLHNLHRLREELESFAPNLIIALGNTALWALCGTTGIGKYRGAVRESTLVPGRKVLPTYHPAGVLRNWSWKVVSAVDHLKARGEAEFPEIRRKKRLIYIHPQSPEELWDWGAEHIEEDCLLSLDIETKRHKFVSCIGMAPNEDVALVVPFISMVKPSRSYWNTVAEEREAWRFCKFYLETWPCDKIGQNFQGYDQYFLAKNFIPIFPSRVLHDTMAEHHALQPEMDKDLGFLTASYLNEPAYKVINPKGSKTGKRDE